MKKLLRKEQKKLSKGSSAPTTSEGVLSQHSNPADDPTETQTNQSSTVDEAPISIKFSKSAAVDDEAIAESAGGDQQSAPPPPLPKLKLKISSSDPKSVVKDRPPSTTMDAAANNGSGALVKPLKINLGKQPKPAAETQSTGATETATLPPATDEDEIELGEVIKPKSVPPKMTPPPTSDRLSPMQHKPSSGQQPQPKPKLLVSS